MPLSSFTVACLRQLRERVVESRREPLGRPARAWMGRPKERREGGREDGRRWQLLRGLRKGQETSEEGGSSLETSLGNVFKCLSRSFLPGSFERDIAFSEQLTLGFLSFFAKVEANQPPPSLKAAL